MNQIIEISNLYHVDELQRLFENREHILGCNFTRRYEDQMRLIIISRLEQVILNLKFSTFKNLKQIGEDLLNIQWNISKIWILFSNFPLLSI